MSFFGCSIKEKKPFVIKSGNNKVLHLSEACITPESGSSKVYLQLQQGEEKYNLCALQKDKWESFKLDHFLLLTNGETKPFKLILTGASNVEVHVTGYIESEEAEDEEDVKEVVEEDEGEEKEEDT